MKKFYVIMIILFFSIKTGQARYTDSPTFKIDTSKQSYVYLKMRNYRIFYNVPGDSLPSGGGSSPWTVSGDTVYITGKKVGIGTATPTYDFTLAGEGWLNNGNKLYFGDTKNYISGQIANLLITAGGGSISMRVCGGDIRSGISTGWKITRENSIYTMINNDDSYLKIDSSIDSLNLTAGGQVALGIIDNGGLNTTTK